MPRPLLVAFFFLTCLNLRSQSLFDSLYTGYRTEVYFATGKAELSAADGLRLDTLVSQLRAQPLALHIRITAHTDSVGNPAANQTLSERRAQTLYKALQQRGLKASDIDIAGFGEKQPAASNDTEEGRQRNRRATLEVIKQAPMATFGGRITDKTTGEGIPAERMTYKGYGNKEMLFPKGGSEEKQQQNRRVEIKVTSN